jgi:ubiquinone/menaquinone biosynthesis C-methylase UbiE
VAHRFLSCDSQRAKPPETADLSVLELGSGPGFLARHLLEILLSVHYVALDFSPAMHTLAQEYLGALAERVVFIEANFK